MSLWYEHEITDLWCNPYRIITTYNEVATITYDLTVPEDLEILIYAPSATEALRSWTGSSSTLNGTIWNGTDSAGKYPSENSDEYILKVKYAGMKENLAMHIAVYR